MKPQLFTRPSLIALSAVIGWTLIGAAMPVSAALYARDQVEARYDLDRSDSDVASARRVADQAQANFDDADARARESGKAARALEARQSELNDRIDDNAKSLSELPPEDATPPADLAAVRDAFHDARDDFRTARDAVRKAETQAYESLESTEEYRVGASRADESAEAAARAEKRVIDALGASDPQYGRAIETFESARTRVELLSKPPVDDADLADARKELAAAQQEVDAIEEPALAADTEVVKARDVADRAGANLKAFRAKFDRDQMPMFPEVADARKDLAAARKAYDSALADLRKAEDQSADAQERRAKLVDTLAADRRELHDVKDEFDRIRVDAKAAAADANASRAELDRALADVTWTERNRADALNDFQQSQEVEDTFCRWGSSDFVFSYTLFTNRYYVPRDCYRPEVIVYRDGFFCPPVRPIIFICPRHPRYRSVWVSNHRWNDDLRRHNDGGRPERDGGRPGRDNGRPARENDGRDGRFQSDSARRATAEAERQQRLNTIQAKQTQLAQVKVARDARQVEAARDRAARLSAEQVRRDQDRAKVAAAEQQRISARTSAKLVAAADRPADKFYPRQRAFSQRADATTGDSPVALQRDEVRSSKSAAARERQQAVREANALADAAKTEARRKAQEDRSVRKISSKQQEADSDERKADATSKVKVRRSQDAARSENSITDERATREVPDRQNDSAKEKRSADREAARARAADAKAAADRPVDSAKETRSGDREAARSKASAAKTAAQSADRDATQSRQATRQQAKDRDASEAQARQQQQQSQRQAQQADRAAQRDAADRAATQRDAARASQRETQRSPDRPSRQSQPESRRSSDSPRSQSPNGDNNLNRVGNNTSDSSNGRRR